jgi:uncharacterized RDD family membrane protein YckC
MIETSDPGAVPTARVAIGYAGFWRRAAAYLIDLAILWIVQATLAAGVLLLVPQAIDSIDMSNAHASTRAFIWDFVAVAENLANVFLVSAALTWAYHAILESSPARATIGKAALGLFVGDLHGDPISFWRATLRYWLKVLSSLLLMTGWLMAAFTPRKQALHDLLAGTLVLRRVTYYVTSELEESAQSGEYWDGARWITAAQTATEG